MRCCVQNCTNDDLKKTNKSKGITFHKLPKDPEHCAAWLKILSDTGCRLSKWLVVCSDHFKPEDFDESRPNQRRVKSGVVPRVMAPLQNEFKVCRVCLALDVKMYDMKNFNFSEMFQNITGILACDQNEGTLHNICWECAARLKAAATFRDKALLSDALLKDLVHINKSDIATLKENHTSLKSPLAFKFGVENVHYISENIGIEILPNNEVLKERKTIIRVAEDETEIGFEEYEPWIDAPVKHEIESDPIAENDTYIQQIKQDPTIIETSEDEIRNTDEQMNNSKDIISINKTTNVPIVNDDSHVILVDDKDLKPKLDNVILTFEVDSSSDEDTQSTADEKLFNKAMKKMNSKPEATPERIRLTDRKKEKIIALRKQGLPIRTISRETGISVKSIDRFWSRYLKNGNTYKKSTTAVNEPSDATWNFQYKPAEPGKEMGPCSEIVRKRLFEAGLEHVLLKKPEKHPTTEPIIDQRKASHDDLKQRIIALMQEGIAISRIAYLLDTSRITVRKWWDRWCNDGHMQNLKGAGRKRKTTPEEDQLLIDRVMQEQTVHTPSLAMELGISTECLRRRLKKAGFKHMERKAYVPLKTGRSHKWHRSTELQRALSRDLPKEERRNFTSNLQCLYASLCIEVEVPGVDEELKQQIISMKLNGVSVTDMANQFRVPRTTIYQWCQRWCKDNNVKMTSEPNISLNMSTEPEQTSTEAAIGETSLPLQTPAILSSQKSRWQKLPDVKYVP